MLRRYPISARHVALVAAVALLAAGLGGCGTINGVLVSGMGDYLPQWLGGLPADAPPRPGTTKYDEFMKERERKRQEPAPTQQATEQTPSSSLDPIH